MPLTFDNVSGNFPNGAVVSSCHQQHSRVVIIGPEPLLETKPNHTNQLLTLYAPAGSTNNLESASELALSTAWSQWQQVVSTNLSQTYVLPISNAAQYFRVLRQ